MMKDSSSNVAGTNSSSSLTESDNGNNKNSGEASTIISLDSDEDTEEIEVCLFIYFLRRNYREGLELVFFALFGTNFSLWKMTSNLNLENLIYFCGERDAFDCAGI